jgi:hypothetical protein
MVQKAALGFGIVFVVIGLGGFLPFLVSKDSMGMDLLLGIFMVGVLHNIIHLLSGVAALASSSSAKYARLYFQVFGVVYALVTVIGFIQGDTVLGILPVNMADNFLHLVIAASSLYLGFGPALDSRSNKAAA